MKIKVKLKSKIRDTQQAALLLNQYEPTGNQPAKTFYLKAAITSQDEIEVPIDIIQVPAGKYLLRVQIDGNQSLLQQDETGKFVKPIIEIKSVTPSIELHSDDIILKISSRDGDNVTIEGQVNVKDNKNQNFADAEVSVKWTKPDGSMINRTALSNTKGIAAFSISGQNGVYRLKVENISKSNSTFNRNLGEIEDSIDTQLNVLRAENIYLFIDKEEDDNLTICTMVQVNDAANNPVKDAEVTIKWEYPNHPSVITTEKSGPGGKAYFHVQDGRGFYKVTLLDIKKTDFIFDRDHSILTRQIDTSKKIMRSTDIILSLEEKGENIRVNGAIVVEDNKGSRVEGAKVSIKWKRADGTVDNQAANTNNEGAANFSAIDGRGTYTLSVLDISKDKYIFDSNNSVLEKSITTPSKALISKNIDLSLEESGEKATVKGQLLVKDEKNSQVRNARVSVKWMLGDGTLQEQTEYTDDEGYANFLVSNSKGSCTLRITDITKNGYNLDKEQSILEKSIISPKQRLVCTDIDLSIKETSNSAKVTAGVLIADETGAKIKGAKVNVRWDLPDNTSQNGEADTTGQGNASFSINDGKGIYALAIIDVTKAGYTFDRDNSIISKNIVSTLNTLRSAHIEIKSQTQDNYAVVDCKVFVRDENNKAVSDATVYLTWTLPDNSVRTMSEVSDKLGVTKFSIKDKPGTYTVMITNISKAGYHFNPNDSVLSRNITV